MIDIKQLDDSTELDSFAKTMLKQIEKELTEAPYQYLISVHSRIE
jgi:hypothetical protein